MTARTRPADQSAPVQHIEPIRSFEEEHPVLATCLYLAGLAMGLCWAFVEGWLP